MIKHLSPSTVQSYRKCGRLVLYEKVLGLPNTTKYAATIYGSAMHDAIEKIMIAKRDGQPHNRQMFCDSFEEKYLKTAHETTVWGEDSAGHMVEQGRLACEDFYNNIFPKLSPKEVEKKYFIERGEGKLPILSYADLVTDDGFVYDYKFGRGLGGSANSLEYLLNMSTYAYGYAQENQILPVVRMIKQKWSAKVQANKKKKWHHKGFEIEQLKINDPMIQYYMGLYDTAEQGIKAGIYLPASDGNGLCKECAYRGNPCDVVLGCKFEVMAA